MPHQLNAPRGSRAVYRRMDGAAFVILLCGWLLSGCHGPEPHSRRSLVDAELMCRVNHTPGPTSHGANPQIPPTVVLEDGLTEDEAIALALWNNAVWQELLAELGLSRAQLLEAGLLTDPLYSTFFPLGPKQLEFTATIAVDAIWLRPVRVRAAELDLDSVAERMVQNGLNVMRDVRLAHADLLRAQQQSELAAEALELRKEITGFAERRLQAGDISELEVITLRIDAVQARADAERLKREADLALERLKAVAGIPLLDVPLTAVDGFVPPLLMCPPEELVLESLAMRPDLRAAELAIEAAGVRAGLERRQCMRISALIDANGRGRDGFEIGPGALLTIPIFNGNRGQIALADARLQQAMRNYVTVRDQIALDVRSSLIQAEQAQQNLTILQNELLPSVQESIDLARRNYERGAVPYFLVLQSTAQFLDARTRELDQQAALRRALAELERSVGRRFLTAPDQVPYIPAEIRDRNGDDERNGPELPEPPTLTNASANPPVNQLASPVTTTALLTTTPRTVVHPNRGEQQGFRAAVIQAVARVGQNFRRSPGPELPAQSSDARLRDSLTREKCEGLPSAAFGRGPSARRSVPRAGFQLISESKNRDAAGTDGKPAGRPVAQRRSPERGPVASREVQRHAE